MRREKVIFQLREKSVVISPSPSRKNNHNNLKIEPFLWLLVSDSNLQPPLQSYAGSGSPEIFLEGKTGKNTIQYNIITTTVRVDMTFDYPENAKQCSGTSFLLMDLVLVV